MPGKTPVDEGEAAGRVAQRGQVLQERDLHVRVVEQHVLVPGEAGLLFDEHGIEAPALLPVLIQYRAAIVNAFADTEVALSAAAGADAQALAQAEELAQARRAVTLSEARYRAGAETLLTLLDNQRTFYAAQDLSVQLRLARLRARVAMYRALGGGWGG